MILITRKQRIIRISFEQLRSIMPNDKNKKRFYASVLSFAKKPHSLKAQKIDIDSDDFEVFSSYIFFEYIQAQQRYALLTLKLTKPSSTLIQSILADFASYEIQELYLIGNTYAKNLYRLLKHYRDVGVFRVSWGDFRESMKYP